MGVPLYMGGFAPKVGTAQRRSETAECAPVLICPEYSVSELRIAAPNEALRSGSFRNTAGCIECQANCGKNVLVDGGREVLIEEKTDDVMD